jgi:hypothetical protein
MQRDSGVAIRREPTGLNVLGETMVDYYQRRTNEAAREIERLRAKLAWIADHSNDPAVVRECQE